MASEMSRTTNVRDVTHKPGEGVCFCDSPAATKGAKDSLSGKNTTQTYSVSSKVSGPFGAMNKDK